MKKIYLLLLAVTALYSASTAQCPNGFAFPFKYNGCYVFVTGTLPNADISVYSGVQRINTTEAQTNSNGQGTVFFDCNQTITRVILTTSTGTVCEISGANIAALAVLPVKLSDFRVQVKNNNTAAIQWASSFELDSYKYIVLRSTDGINYIPVSEVLASGNSMKTQGYKFDDITLGNGAAFYRLKMVDIDGRSELSKVVYINNKKGAGGTLSVFPNPFRGDIQLVGITTSDINKRSIRVYSIGGKEINYSVTGANAITIDPSVPRGVYILRVKEQTYKLVKE
jgi:hypothetical protein